MALDVQQGSVTSWNPSCVFVNGAMPCPLALRACLYLHIHVVYYMFFCIEVHLVKADRIFGFLPCLPRKSVLRGNTNVPPHFKMKVHRVLFVMFMIGDPCPFSCSLASSARLRLHVDYMM